LVLACLEVGRHFQHGHAEQFVCHPELEAADVLIGKKGKRERESERRGRTRPSEETETAKAPARVEVESTYGDLLDDRNVHTEIS
jgi:hypothetical protein